MGTKQNNLARRRAPPSSPDTKPAKADIPPDIAETTLAWPVHPGTYLEEEFMKPLGMLQADLARASHLKVQAISEIINGKRKITAETAIKLGRGLGIAPMFILNLQSSYDLGKLGQPPGDLVSTGTSDQETEMRTLDDGTIAEVKTDVLPLGNPPIVHTGRQGRRIKL